MCIWANNKEEPSPVPPVGLLYCKTNAFRREFNIELFGKLFNGNVIR